MKNIGFIILLLTVSISTVSAQKYLTKSGHIQFFSSSPMEDIEAQNNQVTSILDMESGEVVFSLLMKGFHFEKALMEEHFNEKYVHSDKYPKSIFKGMIANPGNIELDSDEAVKVDVAGTLQMHGLSKEVTTTAELKMVENKLTARAVFPITLADFDIKIPGAVKNNIAKVVEVTVEMDYEPYNR